MNVSAKGGSVSKKSMLFLGIDVGTQGARVIICDSRGAVAAQAEEPLSLDRGRPLAAGWFEQNPSDWWAATIQSLRRAARQMQQAGIQTSAVRGISVTSTSGTVCLVDSAGNALGPALMYNDQRSTAEADEVNRVGAALASKLGYRFSSSFALPKLVWLRQKDSARFERARYFLSPTDFIIGRLTGVFDLTDYTNALKTGYDLLENRWPDFIESELGIPRDRLPRVAAPAVRAGGVTRQAAEETGFEEGTPVLAGMTDGCASQVSTGAVAPKQWNSTLGTTLVIKGVSRELLRDPTGSVYCHRHPDGYWLPGGASNTGAECMARRFDRARLEAFSAEALRHAPTDMIAYPLARTGERFPFLKKDAQGFILDEVADEAKIYTAYLEGVGYLERLAYEMLQKMGAEVGNEIHVAGGTTKVAAWLQLRADILNKTLLAPANSGGAMGAAVIAAGGTIYEGIVPAARAMVRILQEVKPRPEMKARYDERYHRFCSALRERGYIV